MEQGSINKQFVSELAFMHDREIFNKVADLYGEMNQIDDVWAETGRYVPTSQDEYYLHVNTRLHSAATVAGAEAAPAASADTDIVLTAGSVKPRKYDIGITPDRFRFIVKAVSGNTITVGPLDETLIAHEEFTGNEKLGFFSNAYPEGSGVEQGYRYPTSTQSNNVQIIKGQFSTTDLEASNQTEVTFQGQNYYMIKGTGDALKRYKLDVAFTMLFGERSVGALVDGKPVMTTHGLEKSIRGNGINLPLDFTSGTTLEANFKTFNRNLDQVRGPKEYWMWSGPDAYNNFDDWLINKPGLTNGGIVYNSFKGIQADRKDRAVQFGFKSFNIWGRTWHQKSLEAFDNIEMSAADGMTYPETVMMIPANQVFADNEQGMIDRFRIRYKKFANGYGLGLNDTRMYHEKVTGGLAQTPTNQIDNLEVAWSTIQGCEFTGSEHFGINTLV